MDGIANSVMRGQSSCGLIGGTSSGLISGNDSY